MKVSKLIAELQRDYKPDDELIVAYWDKNFIGEMNNSEEDITEEDFRFIAEADYDWSSINEQISDTYDSLLQEKYQEEQTDNQEKELWEA
jgi:hypothetical protein